MKLSNLLRPPVRLPAAGWGWAAPLLFAVIGVGFAVPPVLSSLRHPPAAARNKDYCLWFKVGTTVRAGGPIYTMSADTGEVEYMYPPPMAVAVFAPLSALGWPAFVAVLATGNALAWAVCVYLCAWLIGARARAEWLLPGVAVGPYVWDLFLLGQVNLVLLALFLGAVLAVRHGRPGLAGCLFGTAVAAKVFPLPAVAYFVARREWRAVAISCAVCGLWVFVVPGAVRGFDRTADELRQWAGRMLADQSGETMAARSSLGFTRRNQSLAAVSHRLLRPVDAGDRAGVPFRVNVADVSPRTAQLIGYAGCLALGVVLLWATWLRFAESPQAEALEVGMVAALVPLCSPLAWTYFFCWLLPGWAALVSMRHRPAAWIGGCVSGGLLALALSEQFDPLLQAYGVTAWGAVGLLLTLAWLRRTPPAVRPASRLGPETPPRRVGPAAAG